MYNLPPLFTLTHFPFFFHFFIFFLFFIFSFFFFFIFCLNLILFLNYFIKIIPDEIFQNFNLDIDNELINLDLLGYSIYYIGSKKVFKYFAVKCILFYFCRIIPITWILQLYKYSY